MSDYDPHDDDLQEAEGDIEHPEPQPQPTHTPGPWTTNGKSIVAKGRLIASTGFDVSDDGHMGNALLIAAAPDLLAALADIVANIDGGGCPWRGSVMHETARAAIAKALGK